MANRIQKAFLFITGAKILALASTFNVPAMSGYREYRVNVRCTVNDTNFREAVDSVRFPGGSVLTLSFSRSLIPEPAPSFYGIFLTPGHIGDTVVSRYSALHQWKSDYGVAWIENSPDTIWANAMRYPTKTDSADWALPMFSQNSKIKYGKVVYELESGTMKWPYNPPSSHALPGYKGILYGTTNDGARIKFQADSVHFDTRIYKCCNDAFSYEYKVATFLDLRIGYDASGKGNFENPISINSYNERSKCESKNYGSSPFVNFVRQNKKLKYRMNGIRIELGD